MANEYHYAFFAGRAAYHEGRPASPYPKDSPLNVAWSCGYYADFKW